MSIRERHVRQKRLTRQQRAKQQEATAKLIAEAKDERDKEILTLLQTGQTQVDESLLLGYSAALQDLVEFMKRGRTYEPAPAVEVWSWSGLLEHLVDAANITTTDKVLVPVIANDLLLNLIPDGGRVSALVANKWWFRRLSWTARVALLVPKDITKLNWQRRFDRILFVSAMSKEVAEAQIISSIKLLANDAKLVVLVPASISAHLVANIPPITASRILETEAGDKFRILTYEV